MLYTRILKPANRNYLKGITYSVFFAFLLSLSSCYTVSEETITPQELKTKENYTILEAKLKNDSIVNLEEYDVSYYTLSQVISSKNDYDSIKPGQTNNQSTVDIEYHYNSDNPRGVLKYMKIDTVITIHDKQKEYKYKKSYKEMSLDSVSSLNIRIEQKDEFLTYLAWSGFILGTLSLIVYLAMVSWAKKMSGFKLE